MLAQAININNASFDLLKPVNYSGEANLPALNSLVEVKVLEMFGKAARLLINGKVFFAQFPGMSNPDDLFIARVINHLPFTLSLTINDVKQKTTQKEMAFILATLGMSNSDKGKKVLKSFLESKKPVEKSKLERITEYLENEKIDPDEEQLALLLNASNNSDLKEFTGKGQKWIFSKSIDLLKIEIKNSVRSIFNLCTQNEITVLLNKYLVIDIDSGEQLLNLILNKKETSIENLILHLNGLNLTAIPDLRIRNEILKLRDTLLQFRILQQVYISTGVYPQLLIIKNGDEMEILRYNFQKRTTITSGKNFHIQMEIDPGNLNPVVINSVLSHKNVLVNFQSECSTLEKLQVSKKELEKNLLSKLNVSPIIKFSENTDLGFKTNSTEYINVKI